MTSFELVELMAYDRLYPFGYDRLDLQNANLLRQVAFGALQNPSTDIMDYLTIGPLAMEDNAQVQAEQTYTQVQAEQQRVSDVLDMMWG